MKDVLSKEQVRNIIAGVSRLVQPDEISERADLGCHICALGNTCETLRAENARLRAVETAARNLVEHRRKAAVLHSDGRDTEGNEADNVEWMFYNALEAALDAGKEPTG